MMTEVRGYSETSVCLDQATRCSIPEDTGLHKFLVHVEQRASHDQVRRAGHQCRLQSVLEVTRHSVFNILPLL